MSEFIEKPEKPNSTMPRETSEPADEDDAVHLSPFTLSALQEFVSEQLEREQKRQEAASQPLSADPDQDFEEDWQLSQFWYDQRTCRVLGAEAVRLAGAGGHVACLSCPTLYRHLRKVRPPDLKRKSPVYLTLLEYDQRFSVFGDEFVLYDYRAPLEVPNSLREQFDLVIADPPFLSEECLTKTAATIQLLAKHSVLLCTGSQMGPLAAQLLDVHECRFRPAHTNNLANEFRCFANYDMDAHVTADRSGAQSAGHVARAGGQCGADVTSHVADETAART